ncbi:MAG: superoxide dismutase [Fe] [Alphaproteobacteria bacterium]|nr:superoxide dismutase [Fe] [Alphaproteobacteria bacterium]
MAVSLPPLPYARDGLAPHMSEQTMDFHYGKHHQAYVDNTNKAIDGGPLANASLEEIIGEAVGKDQGLFNNSAQIWNHTFFWHSMKPKGGGAPTGAIADAIKAAFGGYDAFKDEFSKAGATQFGSGWAWLVAREGKLEIRKTANAETPLTEAGVVPLLTMDVWEHAYYLDHQNKRPAYIGTFLDHLVNWDFANENLAKA